MRVHDFFFLSSDVLSSLLLADNCNVVLVVIFSWKKVSAHNDKRKITETMGTDIRQTDVREIISLLYKSLIFVMSIAVSIFVCQDNIE